MYSIRPTHAYKNTQPFSLFRYKIAVNWQEKTDCFVLDSSILNGMFTFGT